MYDAAIDRLTSRGLTYECYCTRREIQKAASAPHAPQGAYPGTCRDLTEADRDRQRNVGRPPALRLRSAVAAFTVVDELHGAYTGVVDDLVLRRGDGTPAYNLAVVVDDGDQGVDQVVRGDDLLPSTPRQAYLASLLGVPIPRYAHVPLALNSSGQRLAKRDGAVTLADQVSLGRSPARVLGDIAASLALSEPGSATTPRELLARFAPADLPHTPWTFRQVTN
jgi:glutamyl-tRNA synthetase